MDPITSIQDSIDNFSLAAFTALREVRDVSLNDIAMSERADAARQASDLARRAGRAKGGGSGGGGERGGKRTRGEVQLTAEEEEARDAELADRVAADVLAAHDKIVFAVNSLPFKDSTLFGEVENLRALQEEILETEEKIKEREREGREVLELVRATVKREAKRKIEEGGASGKLTASK